MTDYMLDPPEYEDDDEYPYIDEDYDFDPELFDDELFAANAASAWENERDFS